MDLVTGTAELPPLLTWAMCFGEVLPPRAACWEGRGNAAINEAARQGGEVTTMDATTGMEELSLLWTSAMGCGEWLPSLSRTWGGRVVADVDKAARQGGETAAVDAAAELHLLWTWAIGCREGSPPWTRPWEGQGGSPSWTRPRDKEGRIMVLTGGWGRVMRGMGRHRGQGRRDGGIASTVDVVNERWGGVTTVDKAAGTAGELLSWLRPRNKGEGPPPATRKWGQVMGCRRGRGHGTLGKGCHCGRGRRDCRRVAAVDKAAGQGGWGRRR